MGRLNDDRRLGGADRSCPSSTSSSSVQIRATRPSVGGVGLRRSPSIGRRRRMRWFTVSVSVVAVLILLSSSIGLIRAAGSGGAFPAGIVGSATPYYPLLVPPSMWPSPDTAVPSTSGVNLSLPQLVGVSRSS